jgi:hypothetical protein
MKNINDYMNLYLKHGTSRREMGKNQAKNIQETTELTIEHQLLDTTILILKKGCP